jgi:hypothetical protein
MAAAMALLAVSRSSVYRRTGRGRRGGPYDEVARRYISELIKVGEREIQEWCCPARVRV